jgi:photosystem II stability/assembly factor-like uncharacterized protein
LNSHSAGKGAFIVKYVIWAVAAALAVGAAAGAVAEQLPAAEVRQNLFASCFVSDSEGWTVGDLGRIFHTVDGAKTWQVQDAGTKRPFVSITCPDKTHLWASGQAGQIARSTDGGATWQMQNSGVKQQLLDIAFVDLKRGFAVGDFGTMLRTEDGGATWTKIPLPEDTKLPPDVADVVAPGDVVLYSASFGTPDQVWIAGEFGVILASADGGQTWHSQESPVENSLFGVYFADAQRGWAVGIESTLLVTTDGGISWRKQEVETPKGFSLALYDVEVRGEYGWAVGNSGYLLNSKDAGKTWHLVDVPVEMGSSWFRGVSLLPNGRGFVVGAKGLVLAADGSNFTPLKKQF